MRLARPSGADRRTAIWAAAIGPREAARAREVERGRVHFVLYEEGSDSEESDWTDLVSECIEVDPGRIGESI